jgi:RNA recognition motif-containing protein
MKMMMTMKDRACTSAGIPHPAPTLYRSSAGAAIASSSAARAATARPYSAPPCRNSRTRPRALLYVGNIPWDATEEEVMANCAAALGRVLSFELKRPHGAALTTPHEPRGVAARRKSTRNVAHRGFGFMEFEDEEAAASAIRRHRRFPILCRNRCLRIAYPANNAMNRKEFMNIGHMNDRISERKIRDCNNNNNSNRRRKKKHSSSRSCIPAPGGNSLEDQPIKAVHEQQQLMNLKIKKRPHSDTTTTYSMEADDGQQPVHHHQEDARHRRHSKKMFVESSTISSSTASRTTEADQFESDLLKIIRMLSCTRIQDSS